MFLVDVNLKIRERLENNGLDVVFFIEIVLNFKSWVLKASHHPSVESVRGSVISPSLSFFHVERCRR